MTDYDDFLRAKVTMPADAGFPCEPHEVNPLLKPHQIAMVCWAVQGGRRAIFAAFGLGKSVMQLEIVRIIRAKAGGMGLIVIPLGVRQEFIRDAAMLGIKVKFIRRIEECDDPEGIYLTNYETIRDGKLDPTLFVVASLDEASCLRGFGGTKTFREFMALFAGDRKTINARVRTAGVRYRFVATATPSPNEFIELLAYAAFLGIMDVGQAKTRFFKRNSEKADQLTIHPHKEEEFWLWCASWGLFVQRPSDLGFSDEGYVLPALDVRWHEIPADHAAAGHEVYGQARMFKAEAIGIVEASREKRDSLSARVAKLMEIIRADVRQSRPPGLQQGVLPQEQGAAAGRAEGARSATRAGRARRAGPVPAGVPGCEQGSTAGEAARQEQGELCVQQASLHSAQEEGASQEVRDHGGPEAGDPGHAGAPVPDLRALPGGIAGSIDRPLPRVRIGAGDPVQTLQCGAWAAGGEPGQSGAGAGVLEHAQGAGDDQVVIWCDLNDEQRAIEKALAEASLSCSSLHGSQEIDDRDTLLAAWRNRETCAFLTKPSMYGAGVNLQQCHTMVFAGISFKAQDILQAIHRIHRFQQKHDCTVHLIYTEAERKVRRDLERKWAQHNEMVSKMTDIIRQFGLSQANMAASLTRRLGVDRQEVKGDRFTCVHNDCVRETRAMAENSVGLVLTSIPFSTQYEYSPNYADFGHTDNNAHFFDQMDYLVPELLRVLQPGRIAAIHVKDRIVPSGLDEHAFQTVYPFHLDTIQCFRRHGFGYMGMKTIVTDVVRENAQTYRLSWTEQCKDGTKMGVGMPEYLLIFRKPPSSTEKTYADLPVVKQKAQYTRANWQADAHGFARSSGDRLLDPVHMASMPHDEIFQLFKRHSLETIYNYEHHVRVSQLLEDAGKLPTSFMLLQPQSWSDEVWTDITRMLTLNSAQSAKGKEMHLCPMQFDIADRAIKQWSNKGEEVYDPFGGLMTVPYRAIKLGRYGRGCELAPNYWLDGVTFCQAMEREISMPSLFDTLDLQAA